MTTYHTKLYRIIYFLRVVILYRFYVTPIDIIIYNNLCMWFYSKMIQKHEQTNCFGLIRFQNAIQWAWSRDRERERERGNNQCADSPQTFLNDLRGHYIEALKLHVMRITKRVPSFQSLTLDVSSFYILISSDNYVSIKSIQSTVFYVFMNFQYRISSRFVPFIFFNNFCIVLIILWPNTFWLCFEFQNK